MKFEIYSIILSMRARDGVTGCIKNIRENSKDELQGMKKINTMYPAILVLLTTFVVTLPLHAQAVWKPQHAFSAELIGSNQNTGEVYPSTQVTMGQSGMRMETRIKEEDRSPFVYLQNFASRKTWLLDLNKAFYAEIPDESASDDAAQVADTDSGGLMSTEPCMALEKQSMGTLTWQQLEVTRWRCKENGVERVTQLFSTKLGMVVHEQWSNGDVLSLSHIVLDAHKEEVLFEPPDHFQQVDLHVFFTGTPELNEFKEE